MSARLRSFRLALVALLSLGGAMPLCAETLKGKVVFVADGDTLTMQVGKNKREKVRLLGIDAPEHDQAYGAESGKLLAQLVKDKVVTVRFDMRDDYGRILGMVSLDNLDINLEMVKRGAAWHYAFFFPDAKHLAQAEKAARKAHAGLWKASNPIAPWDFRRAAKQAHVPTDGGDKTFYLQGVCTRVADGDTLTLRTQSGESETIQLFGIDAPERGQQHGAEAKAALEALVLNKTITVTASGRDDFGRVNGKVYLNGEYINLALVKDGHAWHSDKYGPNEGDLRAAQKKAQSSRKGLWEEEHPQEPWRFRNERKTESF